MKKGFINITRKVLKIIGITIVSIVLILYLLPYILPGKVAEQVKKLVNRSIEGEVNFSKARLSFFKHFPSLTLTLHDFSMKGSAPFEKDDLLNSDEISFGINIAALVQGDIHVDKFFLSDADINVIVNRKGEANYNVYRTPSKSSSSSSSVGGDTTASLRIEKIVIENTNVVYNDLSASLLLVGKGLNYTGKGDLSKAIFDLRSHLKVDSFDLYYDNEPYILKKKINAELITRINTNALAFKFEKNKVRINRLPMEFVGRFDFLSRGYDMEFRIKSMDAGLDDVFSVIPPQYQGWLNKTVIRGDASIIASLAGRQISGTDTMPDLDFEMKIRDGYIAYDKAPVPVSNLFLDFDTHLPSLNPDSLFVNVDSNSFNLGKDYFNSVVKIKGLESPYLLANINSTLNLETLHRALGIASYDFKGRMDFHLRADGRVTAGQNPNSLREEIIITGIPSFSLQSSVSNGYFHDKSLPEPMKQINFNMNVVCPDNNYRHTSLVVENIDIKAMNNYIKGFVRLKNLVDFPVEADLDAKMNLSDIHQFYPLDSMRLDGNLSMNIKSNGKYQPAKKIFPKTIAALKLENGLVQTKYYPAPIEKISVDAMIQNKEGTMADLGVDLEPVSFEFEDKPFFVQANLQDFDNLQYNIKSKGEIDLGRIYRVFSQEGWDVKGTIETDLSLKGIEADAIGGRYHLLQNSGTLIMKNIKLSSDLYPLPFEIDKGVFRFVQDKMKFEEFSASYGQSDIKMNGSLTNLFNYMTGDGPLKGNFQLRSDYIMLDELMAFNTDSSSVVPDSTVTDSSGVIILPNDLDMQVVANVKRVDYNGLKTKDVKGEVLLKNGELKLNETGFIMADASTVMDATYKSLSPTKAYFTYHIMMNDFDVKKMYNEVELFRELAPAAGKAEGIISLDYNLEGKLNADMYPVMPSLKGGGVVSVKKVKMQGFRLFSAMGKETGKDEIKDPDLSKINFKTTIKNNIVTLEKTKMKVAGFRIRMQGQTSLDGKLKLKCRLGLPPFGIIGIPISVTGTGQNPKIKVGKSDELPLEEQKEEEEDIGNN